MAGTIWEFFGFHAEDASGARRDAVEKSLCPVTGEVCEKTFNDGTISGVCSIKPVTSPPVICCPIRLYAEKYKVLKDVAFKAFGETLALIPGRLWPLVQAQSHSTTVYKLQEAFNNVTLPEENVYRDAILKALRSVEP